MAHQLRFGVVCPQPAWPVLLEQAQQVEALGFDSIWIIDHVAMRMAPDRPVLEIWTGLAKCALGSTGNTPVLVL